jgi:FHA domain/Double zinc ribbon
VSTPSTCPNGHESQAPDYCDTCGAPITQGGAAAGAPSVTPSATGGQAASEPAAEPEVCPSCGADKASEALFCEACGYDFTTGTMPRPAQVAPVSALDLGTGSSSTPQPLAPTIGVEWVVEVWVDPDWYASQASEDPCPSPGLPAVVPLTAKSVLVGRPSTSRNIHPEVDLTGDPGVSRRHAQLSTDGQRWWVEDLQSSNGTYVGPASGPLPADPIPPGTRRELSEDDRVYVGAWSRLVVRRATPEEQ